MTVFPWIRDNNTLVSRRVIINDMASSLTIFYITQFIENFDNIRSGDVGKSWTQIETSTFVVSISMSFGISSP